jgi:pyruvate dehydrogenase E2 component (dihydrolipoamide acetyltransferase)
MPSVREFTLPDLGEGLTEAEIVRWLVQAGDVVEVDQPVVEVETAKAAVELPCPFAGRITAVHGSPGDIVPVGHGLVAVSTETPAPNVLVGYGVVPEPARNGSSSGPAQPGGPGPVAVVSPLVRRLARQRGVNLGTLAGSGPHGLITRADVLGGTGQVTPPAATRIPLRGREKLAAEKFTRSRREIPDVTCWLDTDATALLSTVRKLAGTEPRLGLSALLARICVDGLAAHPRLNSTVDTERQEIVQWTDVQLGVATESAHGLIVPVVRGANRLSTADLAAELAAGTEAARQGTLAPGKAAGGTFTLNNYGALGVDGATPILNYPEAAMLGVGRITERPVVHRGKPAMRKMVQLTLTFDHRVCDGAYAARFLRFVADRVQQPLLLLRDR